MKKLLFQRCKKCGNVALLYEGENTMVCCGEQMTLLVPNTTDAAGEKHLPVYNMDGDIVNVTVGSVTHPMTEEHHISFIVFVQDGRFTSVMLPHTGEPKARFHARTGDFDIYEYCNLHGLWKTTGKN